MTILESEDSDDEVDLEVRIIISLLESGVGETYNASTMNTGAIAQMVYIAISSSQFALPNSYPSQSSLIHSLSCG